MIKFWLTRATRHFDHFLLGMLLLVIVIALFVLYSASGQSLAQVGRQCVNLTVALSLMWLLSNVSPQRLESMAMPIYVLGVLLLIGVFLFGDISKGARRWLDLGVARIQPSEMMKLAVPMMLAWVLLRDREATLRLADYGIASLMLAIPNGAGAKAARPGYCAVDWGIGVLCAISCRIKLAPDVGIGCARRCSDAAGVESDA